MTSTIQALSSVSTINIGKIYRIGKMRVLVIESNAPISAVNIDRIDAQDWPSVEIKVYTYVYNGSNYVDCYLSVTNSGSIRLMTLYGNVVTGAQLGFLKTNTITWSV